jgi:hypothetical protein
MKRLFLRRGDDFRVRLFSRHPGMEPIPISVRDLICGSPALRIVPITPMNPNIASTSHRQVPEIVHIVLTQAAKLRAEGAISQQKFESQINRLRAEELQPRGFSLLVRELSDGHVRFLIKERSGSVCDMIECEGLRATAA